MPAWPRRTQWRPMAVKTEANVKTEADSKSGRRLISDKRVVGTLQEWKGSFGWVKPRDEVDHPQFRGKIYLNVSDLREKSVPDVGAEVDFVLYTDYQGLGASDCRELPSGEQDDTLPAGWRRVWSEEHSEWYFWNSATKESSWSHPAGDDAGADEEEAPLPEGWEQVLDTERGIWYYWHKATKTACWERPGAEEAGADTGEAEEAADEAEGQQGAVLAQQRVNGTVVEWNSISGWLQPEELDGDLHPLLKDSEEKIYVNWRNIHKGAKIETGMLVSFLISADDSGLRAVDVCEQGSEPSSDTPPPGKRKARARDPLALLEKQWAAQDRELQAAGNQAEAAAEEAEEEQAGEPEDGEGPLLPGWEQHWSEENSCFYYWHVATQQSSWERPAMPLDDGDDDSDHKKVWEGEGAEEGAAKKATPMTPLMAVPGRAMTPITPADLSQQKAKPSAVSSGRAAVAAGILRQGGTPAAPSSSAAAGAPGAAGQQRQPVRSLPRPPQQVHAASDGYPVRPPGVWHRRPQVVLPQPKRPRW
eukprot:TRINITY_DN37809_c0_g1_i1.p1 TRINITY_DN37809_c0_g1~~TRINITY_DN37809_c0_g1_i1.p1  ORF type:complete len:532 (+),score=137.93 TRINITY_DN37809_c0_g1_i1:52-1647(+)